MIQKQKQSQRAKLEIKITHARKNLHSLWEIKGYTDAEVLDASIKLDQLLNQYERLFREE
jgi:hypothetical protein